MTLAEAIALVQRRTGYRSTKADEIYLELKLAQERLEPGVTVDLGGTTFTFLPWFLLQEILTEATTANEDAGALWYYNESAEDPANVWVQLAKGEHDELKDTYSEAGAPIAYSLTGPYFRIFPTPDDVYPLKIMCFQRAATLVNNLTSDPDPNASHLWLVNAGMLLVAEAVKEFAFSVRDERALAWAQTTYAREALRHWQHTEERAHANQRYVMGGAD
jgi:hypothetical protein